MTRFETRFENWERPHIEDEDMPQYPIAFKAGWEACQEEVLKILEKRWTGLDMSINSCDEHYIEKVKRL